MRLIHPYSGKPVRAAPERASTAAIGGRALRR
jgi:hypothetical protein